KEVHTNVNIIHSCVNVSLAYIINVNIPRSFGFRSCKPVSSRYSRMTDSLTVSPCSIFPPGMAYQPRRGFFNNKICLSFISMLFVTRCIVNSLQNHSHRSELRTTTFGYTLFMYTYYYYTFNYLKQQKYDL